MKLFCKQVENQCAEIEALETEVKQVKKYLANISGSAIRMNSFRFFLKKISHSKLPNFEFVHQNKLGKMYSGQVYKNEEREPVIILYNVDLDSIVCNAMYLGLKCHLKS